MATARGHDAARRRDADNQRPALPQIARLAGRRGQDSLAGHRWPATGLIARAPQGQAGRDGRAARRTRGVCLDSAVLRVRRKIPAEVLRLAAYRSRLRTAHAALTLINVADRRSSPNLIATCQPCGVDGRSNMGRVMKTRVVGIIAAAVLPASVALSVASAQTTAIVPTGQSPLQFSPARLDQVAASA